MEAEVIALTHRCKPLLPVIGMVASLGDEIGCSKKVTIMHLMIHEDNAEALILAETLLHQHMPWIKHYAKETNCCQEEIVKREKVGED